MGVGQAARIRVVERTLVRALRIGAAGLPFGEHELDAAGRIVTLTGAVRSLDSGAVWCRGAVLGADQCRAVKAAAWLRAHLPIRLAPPYDRT